MIKRKMALVATVFALAASGVFAQEFSFENTLSTDVMNVEIEGSEFEGSFAGFENETVVDFTSEKLDFGLDILFNIGTDKTTDDKGYLYIGTGDNYPYASFSIEDYYIEFRPIDLLGIGFHRSYGLAGSYLPVEDDNVTEAGSIGSDLGVFIRPIDGLVIQAGLDFVSLFGGDDSWDKPKLNFGAEYEFTDLLFVGGALHDIINDDRSMGIYVSFVGLEGFTINGGFTYNGDIADVSGNLLNAGVIFEQDALSIGGDFAVAFGGDADEDFDLYAGVSVGYQITDPFGISVDATFKTDFDAEENGWELGISPAVTYALNDNHEFGAGVDLTFEGGTKTTLAFPIYWTYSF